MLDKVYQPVVEFGPRARFRLYVHGVIIVQKMKREGQDAFLSLVFEVYGGRLPERGQERESRESRGRHIHEFLCQLERLGPLVAIEAEDEVSLYVRHVA